MGCEGDGRRERRQGGWVYFSFEETNQLESVHVQSFFSFLPVGSAVWSGFPFPLPSPEPETGRRAYSVEARLRILQERMRLLNRALTMEGGGETVAVRLGAGMVGAMRGRDKREAEEWRRHHQSWGWRGDWRRGCSWRMLSVMLTKSPRAGQRVERGEEAQTDGARNTRAAV